MYFWHRHLEGADPETRILRKWNGAYGDTDPTTLAESVSFISSMESLVSQLRPDGKELGDGRSMEIVLGDSMPSDYGVKPKLRVMSRKKVEDGSPSG